MIVNFPKYIVLGNSGYKPITCISSEKGSLQDTNFNSTPQSMIEALFIKRVSAIRDRKHLFFCETCNAISVIVLLEPFHMVAITSENTRLAT
jgi:hypothetical protein